MKHGGGSIIIQGCVSAGEMTVTDSTMNASEDTKILANKMTPSLQELGRRAIFQHDRDKKNTLPKTSKRF